MRKYFVTVLAILWSASFQRGLAQDIQEIFAKTLYGEYNFEIARSPVSGEDDRRILLLRTEKQVTVIVKFDDGSLLSGFTYPAPPETRIVSASFKADDGMRVMILLSNGNIVFLVYDPDAIPFEKAWHTEKPIPISLFANAQKIVGDAVYVLKQGKIYVSRDTAKTWQIDTANIGSDYVADITVDTSFYAWAVTQGRKLYYQHPDSNVWRQDTSYATTGFGTAVFVDRKGRIFVSSSASATRVLMSTNGGVTWANVSTGIGETIASFGDDAFGNVYGVGQGSHAYRLSNLTPPWVSIGDSLAAQAYIPSTARIVNTISGDSTIFAATIYGMFQSSDLGANWVHSPNNGQSRAHNFYSPVVRAGNYFFISTNLGVYRVAVGDSAWEKVYPKKGYTWGINALASDSAGNVYGDFPFVISPTTTIFYSAKSTDHGTTWIADTAGQKALGFNAQTLDYAVDAQGTQYLSGNAILYTKSSGQPWKVDTTGLGMKSGEYIRQVSKNNKKGIAYVSRTKSSKFAIYSRSSGASVWQLLNSDTLGATDAILQSDHVGNIIVKVFTTGKIWRYDGIKWTITPLPTGLAFTPNPEWIAVDKNGVIWASITGNTSPANKGVYFTADNGATWKYVGLLGVGVKSLTAVEDTLPGQTPSANGGRSIAGSSAGVYAVTFIDGVYGFTTSTIPTSVGEREPRVASTFELSQNYPNPFNPSTHLQFAISNLQFVQLKVYDVLGREVAVLVNEQKGPGTYTVEWNAAGFSSGVYFYTLKAGGFVQTRKMLVIK